MPIKRITTGKIFALAVWLVASCGWLATCAAQPVLSASGDTIVVDESAVRVQPGPGGAAQPQPGGEQPTAEGEQTGEGEGEGKEKKEGDKAKEGDEAKKDDTVKRPAKPPKIADPRELEATPDDKNRVNFSFTGQAWPDVLQWLANVSGYSLDWTELPGGYLNLSTQRPYTLAEARDLINRQLHARGYTMILQGEVLSVFKIDKLDPSLIPRVEEEALYDLQPHDFVKITFAVPDSIEVAKAAEDAQKMVSEHAKVIALPATKRVLLISTVANARLVSMILNEERLVADGQMKPTEIIVKHRRAEKLIDILYVILGVDPASKPSQQELAIQQQKMQLLMQMQGAGKDVTTMLQKEGPPVYIAYNSSRNSLLVNAPPKELAVIQRSVEMLDVPTAGEPVAGEGPGEAAPTTGERMARSYKLESVDPRSLLSTLEEIGDLSPLTELRADSKAKILFARASGDDHEKISKMIKELDGAQLVTEVFVLRKRPADDVAATLQGLFAPKKEEDDSSSRRGRFYGFYGYGNNEEEEEKPTELRVDADIENNWLIVRGTPEQLVQVRDFLTKLGEPLEASASGDRMRVVGSLDPEETARLINQLRRTWPAIGENELVIQGLELPTEDKQPEEKKTPEAPPADRETDVQAPLSLFRFAVESQPAETAGAEPEREPPAKPPIVLKITPDGRLVLFSEDSAALDQLEQLIESSVAPQERFKIIPVRYVTASSIYLTLDLLYAEEQKGESSEGHFDPYYWEYIPGKSGGKSTGLSKRKKLYFDYDIASNSILVANASPSQLREIEQLIAAYDQPPDADDAKSRRTAAIKIKYNRAKVVATALKDVYRDLLSQRDKEFETEDKKGGGATKETTTIIRYGSSAGGDSDSTKRATPVKVGFQGALSVGVDEISNTIIISVQEELFESVIQIVNSLDEAAKPNTTTVVHSVGGGLSSEALQKALSEALGRPWIGGKPEKEEQQKGDQDGQKQNGEGKNGGERGDSGQPSEGE